MKASFFFFGISQIAPEGAFWAGFWVNFVTGVLATVVVSLLGWLLVKLTRAARHLLKARGRYRITGIWVGKCKLPRHPPNVEAVEIYRLVTKKGEYVTFTLFHYLPKLKSAVKYEGAGIYRGIVLSAFYYIPEPQCSESGVFVLRKAGEKFIGVYAQYDLIADMRLHVSKEDFILKRVQIPLRAQMKMMLGLPPFPCYEQARQLYDDVYQEEPDADAEKLEVPLSPG